MGVLSRTPTAQAHHRRGAAVFEDYSFKSDDHIAHWAAIQAGLGIGFTADYVAASDPKVKCLRPELKLPVLPIWLTVHREIRESGPIRAVYDFLAKEIPANLNLNA